MLRDSLTLPVGIGFKYHALAAEPVQRQGGGLHCPDHGTDNDGNVLGGNAVEALPQGFSQRRALCFAERRENRVGQTVVL